MGTDCRAIAKFKNGVYRTMYLDRYYNFLDSCQVHIGMQDQELPEHHAIFRNRQRNHFYFFDIPDLILWCDERISIYETYVEEKDTREYLVEHIKMLKQFLVHIRNLSLFNMDCGLEFIGVFSEHDQTYEEMMYDASKEKLIEVHVEDSKIIETPFEQFYKQSL